VRVPGQPESHGGSRSRGSKTRRMRGCTVARPFALVQAETVCSDRFLNTITYEFLYMWGLSAPRCSGRYVHRKVGACRPEGGRQPHPSPCAARGKLLKVRGGSYPEVEVHARPRNLADVEFAPALQFANRGADQGNCAATGRSRRWKALAALALGCRALLSRRSSRRSPEALCQDRRQVFLRRANGHQAEFLHQHR
jgi:hypothetical protein